jgi:5-methylcytosine-specific restriction protein A
LDAPGFCDAHKQYEPRKRYDRERTSSPHRRMYGTARWQKLRRMKLNENPFCESGILCDQFQTGRRAVSTDVHHKLGVQDRPDLQWDFDNLEALCHECHSHFTALHEGFASGKSQAA